MAYETSSADGVGTTTHVIVGLFNDAQDAHQAVTQLRAEGFSSSQIGAAFRTHSFAADATPGDAAISHKGEHWWEKVKEAFRSDDTVEKRRDEATGSTLNNDPAQPDREYDFAGDDFENSLAATGIPLDRARYLSQSLRPGGAVITVQDPTRAAQAEEILAANNGRVQYEDVPGTGISVPAGAASFDQRNAQEGVVASGSTPNDVLPADASPVSQDRVQLFGEVLRVHKERMKRGEVRVRKDVVTEHQTIEVPVTREELVLERVAVSDNTPVPSTKIGAPQEIRVPLTEDRVRLEKQSVLREEVMVGKREVSDVQTVSDDVRHEELRIDSDEGLKREATGEQPAADVRRHG